MGKIHLVILASYCQACKTMPSGGCNNVNLKVMALKAADCRACSDLQLIASRPAQAPQPLLRKACATQLLRQRLPLLNHSRHSSSIRLIIPLCTCSRLWQTSSCKTNLVTDSRATLLAQLGCNSLGTADSGEAPWLRHADHASPLWKVAASVSRLEQKLWHLKQRNASRMLFWQSKRPASTTYLSL